MSLILLTLVLSLPMKGAKMQKPAFYARYERIATPKLYELGSRLLNKEGKVDSALVCFTIISNRLEEGSIAQDEKRICVKALNQIANIYSGFYNKYDLADQYIDQAEAIARQENYHELLPQLAGNKSNIDYLYNIWNHPERAMANYMTHEKEVYRLAVRERQWSIASTAIYNICLIALNYKESEVPHKEIRQFMSLNISPNTPMRQIALLFCKVAEAYSKRQYAECASLLRGGIRQGADYNEVNVVQMMQMELAMVYVKMGDRRLTVKQLITLDSIAESAKQPVVKYAIYEELQQYWGKLGDSTKSVHYDYMRLKASEMVDKNGMTTLPENRFIRQLGSVRDQLQRETARRHNVMVGLGVVSIALAIIVMLLILLEKQYQKQKRYADLLYQRNQQLLMDNQLLMDKAPAKGKQATQQKAIDLPQDIEDRIDDVMKNTEIICDKDFSMAKLCGLTGFSHTYVSAAIRQKYGTNFNGLLNSYRIKEACKRLQDSQHYGNLTIEAIAEGLGYASRTNFSAIFKRITGLSASEYIKRNQEQRRAEEKTDDDI